jgi:hypothetical protein
MVRLWLHGPGPRLEARAALVTSARRTSCLADLLMTTTRSGPRHCARREGRDPDRGSDDRQPRLAQPTGLTPGPRWWHRPPASRNGPRPDRWSRGRQRSLWQPRRLSRSVLKPADRRSLGHPCDRHRRPGRVVRPRPKPHPLPNTGVVVGTTSSSTRHATTGRGKPTSPTDLLDIGATAALPCAGNDDHPPRRRSVYRAAPRRGHLAVGLRA